jgi:hypothetical protein
LQIRFVLFSARTLKEKIETNIKNMGFLRSVKIELFDESSKVRAVCVKWVYVYCALCSEVENEKSQNISVTQGSLE